MSDKKRRFFRLLESYINDYQKDAVELMYGKGSQIKVHSWSHNNKGDTFLFELVIVLGDVISESVMEKTMAEVLLKNALVYFYPETEKMKCIVRFDV
jgi:hypothetical protein